MPPICKDEMDDAQQAAEHYGYGEDEFAFLYRPYAPLRSEPVPIVF